MRAIVVLAILAALGLGVSGLARGEEGKPDQIQQMQKQIDVLELQVAYLLDRDRLRAEADRRVLANYEVLGAELRKSRSEGFTKGAISSTSRELLLGGLETATREMARSVPAVTEDQEAILKRIELRLRAP